MFSGSRESGAEDSNQVDSTQGLIGQNFKGYLVKEKIGEGSQGMVYLAVQADESDSHEYALKFCPREIPNIEKELKNPDLPDPKRKSLANSLGLALNEDKRFTREMDSLTQKIEHLNVIKPIKYGTEDERHWVIMPYLGRTSLYDRLQEGWLSVEEALQIFGDVTKGLQAVHDEDVVHRDLKPQNIMLHEGRAIIIDFGFVKGKDDKTFTMPGALIGTTAYLAPEQIACQKSDGKKGDQFSLGVIMFFALTGTFPYPVKGLNSLLRRGSYDYDDISKHRSDLNPSVDKVLHKMIAKAEEDRYDNVKEAFEAFSSSLSLSS